VEKILEVRRGENAVKTYLYYLQNLRYIKETLHFQQTADVDMALWVLYHKCFSQQRDHEIRDCFFKDELLRRIQVRNLVSPLHTLSHAQLAEALKDVQSDLAALIACYELENLIRKFARLKEPDLASPDANGYLPDLNVVIKGLFKKRHIDFDRKDKWIILKKTRDDFFHKGIDPKEKMSSLIAEINKLEMELNSSRPGSSEAM
jgi:hypothetical protein